MELKKQNQVSPEFKRSSLVYIITFLIFFMLAFVIVYPDTINLNSSDDKASSLTVNEKLIDVMINQEGELLMDDKKVSKDQFEEKLKKLKKDYSINMKVTPDKGSPTPTLIFVLDVLARLEIKGTLVAEEK